MELNKINSLVELFFKKYKEEKKLRNQPFLKWLKIEEKLDQISLVYIDYKITLRDYYSVLFS